MAVSKAGGKIVFEGECYPQDTGYWKRRKNEKAIDLNNSLYKHFQLTDWITLQGPLLPMPKVPEKT